MCIYIYIYIYIHIWKSCDPASIPDKGPKDQNSNKIKYFSSEQDSMRRFFSIIILFSNRDIQGSSYLSHGVRQNLDDLLVRRRHHTLAIYLDDAVADADASSLSDASPHQAADLHAHS